MANTLTTVIDKILARGLAVLRESCVMPRLVNSDYSTDAREFGDTIDIEVPQDVATAAITPGVTHATPSSDTTVKVAMALDNWKGNTPFSLSSKDKVEIDQRMYYLPGKIVSAIRQLAYDVNADIMAEYLGVYGFAGTAAGVPFASTVSDATAARKVLKNQLCPFEEGAMWGVISTAAEANALNLAAFSDADKVGMNGVKINGELGRKFGIGWVTDHQVPTHTAGTASTDSDVIAVDNGSGYAAGIESMNVDVDSGTSTFVIGDIFTIAGDTQTYVTTNADTFDTTGVTVTFKPGLSQVVLDNAVITVKASHDVNLVFHRDAFAFAQRTLEIPNGNFSQVQDPQTGLILRLEEATLYKQTTWQFDILWGAKLVRPELACRLAGAPS